MPPERATTTTPRALALAGLDSSCAGWGATRSSTWIGGLVSRVIAVLLLPLYTRYLTPTTTGRSRRCSP